MRIGIVTFWWSQDNYGQLLQCFASQKYLQMQGHDAFLIKVRNFAEEPQDTPSEITPIYKKMLSVSHWHFLFKGIYDRVYHSYVNKYIQNHNVDRHFDEFRCNNLASTNDVFTHDQLQAKCPQVDMLVTGSDMVFGVGLHHHEYLLDFGPSNVKRVALAASCGRTWDSLSDIEKKVYKDNIARFDGITLREEEGVEIFRNLGFKEALRVCDPTMLLDLSVYNELADSATITDCSDKVFMYYIGSDPSCVSDKSIVSVLRARGQAFNYASASVVNNIPKVFPTIEEWIAYIRESRFVITNSFHGVVFCLLFRKQFAVTPLLLEQRNTRIYSLLNDMHLDNRIFRTKDQLSSLLEEIIDYNEVEYLKTTFVNKGKSVLSSFFNTAK